ncbi:hypothetical protein SAY87_020016 [Trapa incisa]|uniref:Uncharacterized protein n=1 Tax=Trapa incisa TaxID=236973 RepID=A0AAN7K0S3_9MYRT|nr:hypothetical protein SAY87_020016 [Trapa incisa]
MALAAPALFRSIVFLNSALCRLNLPKAYILFVNSDFAFLAPRHFCTRNTSHYPKPKIGNTKVHFSLSDSDSELEDDSNEKAEEVGNAAKLPPSYDPLNKNPVISEFENPKNLCRRSRSSLH